MLKSIDVRVKQLRWYLTDMMPRMQITKESASGKTFFFETMKALQDIAWQKDIWEGQDITWTRNLYFLNYESTQDNVEGLYKNKGKGLTVIIDNATVILHDKFPELPGFINTDYLNQYLLLGRGDLGVEVDIYGVCQLVFNSQSKEFSLDYYRRRQMK